MATRNLNAQLSINEALRQEGIEILAEVPPHATTLINPSSLRFVASLHREFEETRHKLLLARDARQTLLDEGQMPDFLPETAYIRESDWVCAPTPADLQDRRVEITGPTDRKMVINALNSGAKVFMCDDEDSQTPTWSNCVEGIANVSSAVRRTISYTSEQGKKYSLNSEKIAVLMVRPRGWHLVEGHMRVDNKPVSASLFDFGMHFYNNAKELIARGSGPYFYLPKMESHLEARLWNSVFVFSQAALGIPVGTIKATVLIETILAAFEMDEILYELRDHSAGLNCGRWDYIFSYIKKFRNHARFVLPDRAQVTMTAPFMSAYVQLLVDTCHRRMVHAMGGMAAQIPIKDKPELNQAAMDKVRADKLREVKAGHDGTWIAHPGLLSVALDAFNEFMPTPNQISVRKPVSITAADLLAVPPGTITAAGVRGNVTVGLAYTEAWLRGVGCVPINNMMEDAATAEICRSQLWQWSHHGAKTSEGQTITDDMISRMIDEELAALEAKMGTHFHGSKFTLAGTLFRQMVLGSERYEDFLTIAAYPYIIAPGVLPLSGSDSTPMPAVESASS